jgi:creatinine amidohydrolase/Fe(II)-dependent formamide hydrolase-like protein
MMSHPAVKPAIWGAVVGAVAIMIAGFWGFGWMLSSTADRMAKDQSEVAVVAALTPVCVARFEAQADAPAKLADLKKVAESWDRSSFIEKGGWATAPGSNAPNSDVARACAEKLGKAV